jgi:two-component system OmpR family sensor kinase
MLNVTLRLRMILLFCVVIGVFLAGTYVVVYDSFAREVRSALDDRLLDIARPAIAAVVAHPLEHHIAGLQLDGQVLQLLGPDGRILEQSNGMTQFDIPKGTLPQEPTPVFRDFQTVAGTLRAAIIPFRRQGELFWFVIAESTSRIDRLESDFQAKAFGLWTVSLLLTTLIAVWYVSRSLSPIVDLSKHAALLTARASRSLHSDLNVSLPIANPNDELGILAANFNVLFARLGAVVGQLRQFVSDAAHELRTPLAVVLGETQLLLAQPRTSEDYRGALLTITDELSTMARIIEGLFTLSMADAGQLRLYSERLFLDEVIQEAAGIATAAARHKRIRIESTHLREIEYLGDQALTRQLFLILLDNAIKYSPPDTTIRISLGFADDRPTAVVRDEGFGIAPEHLPHIFERFYRAAPQSSDESRSGGLGLAIAQAIIQAHGGEIRCSSEPGKGSVFTIVFASLAACQALAQENNRAESIASRMSGFVDSGKR